MRAAIVIALSAFAMATILGFGGLTLWLIATGIGLIRGR